jgi:hypothetical protein
VVAGVPQVTAVLIAQIACGALFLTGLVTGAWKYQAMMADPDGAAPPYVDICHRASLMYAFACLVLAEFARLSVWPEAIDAAAVLLPVLFFASAVAGYAAHGILRDTDNQFRRPHRLGRGHVSGRVLHAYIVVLTVAEVGGFAVLFAGFVKGRLI